jgi:sensor histidine kinase regulating citrate/malate metabolism
MEKLIYTELSDITLSWSEILDASHNGIVIIDRYGVILVYNKAARRLLEDDDHSLVGRQFSEIRPETWPDLKNILETGSSQIGKKLSFHKPPLSQTAIQSLLMEKSLALLASFRIFRNTRL